jgi:hypothetical protein
MVEKKTFFCCFFSEFRNSLIIKKKNYMFLFLTDYQSITI